MQRNFAGKDRRSCNFGRFPKKRAPNRLELSEIMESLAEAARVDGATERQCVRYVVLPQLKPVFYTITMLSFLNSFKVFREAYLVAGAYPQKSMYLLQHLFQNWFTNLEIDKMAAAGVLLAVFFVGCSLALQRLWGGMN